MKKAKKVILAIFFIAVLIFSLASCDEKNEETPEPPSGTVRLYVYNWGEYISEGYETYDSNEAFEEYFNTHLSEKYECNVELVYTTYSNNEEMYTKVASNAGRYDVLVPSDYMIERLISEGLLLSFDVEQDIPNYANINPDFKGMQYDPEERYTVPYTYGMLGVIYNENLVDADDCEAKSWELLWNEKYRGKILQFNNLRDAFGTAMYYKGLDINSTDPEVWNEALDILIQQKSLLQGYVNDEIFNKMTTESAAIAPYYAGDYLTMAEQQEALKFYYPVEGTNYFVDAFCIPHNARNPEIAKEYINFMLTSKPGIENALYLGYASPNDVVRNDLEYQKRLAEDYGEEAYKILYGTDPGKVNEYYINEINRKYGEKSGNTACYKMFSPEIQQHVSLLWERLKIYNSTEPWVHVTSLTIVVSVLSLAVYNVYIKKKRSHDYRMRDKLKQQNKIK